MQTYEQAQASPKVCISPFVCEWFPILVEPWVAGRGTPCTMHDALSHPLVPEAKALQVALGFCLVLLSDRPLLCEPLPLIRPGNGFAQAGK